MEDPKQYDDFRRQNDKFGPGISAIFGIKTKPKRTSELQSIRFDKDKFTPAEAKKWAKDHNHTCKPFESAEGAENVLPISGVIGWDVYPENVRVFLDQADGKDIEVQISSPGGYVYPGLEIYNLLRNYTGHVTTRLMGLAASMASYIAMVGDRVVAEDNAIFMVHNASGLGIGDHKTLRKVADVIEGISNMIAQKYMEKSGKTLAEIKQLMDDETFLFGDEIGDSGFVDEVLKTEKKKDKASAVTTAAAEIAMCLSKMKAAGDESDDLEKAAALLKISNIGGEKREEGTWKYCVCDECNHWEEHTAGKPCGKCPECGAQMHGSDKKNKMEVKRMKTLVEILAIEDADERNEAFDLFFGEDFDEDQKTVVIEALMTSSVEVKAEVNDELVETIKVLQGEVLSLKAEIDSDKKLLDKEIEARRRLEIRKSLDEFDISGDLDKKVDMLFTLEKTDPEMAEDMLSHFKKVSEQLKAAGIFTEAGSAADGEASLAYDKLKKMVDDKVTEGTDSSPAKIWKDVIRDNPELYKQYLEDSKRR